MKSPPKFMLPGLDKRITVMGATGTGKTQFGAWLLSKSAFDQQPFVIIDYKIDQLLNSIENIREIGLNELPSKPGLYIVHPVPDDDDDAVEHMMRKIWQQERTGVYFDETTLIPDRAAFRSLLTQGRSKLIPTIMLTQRPAWVSKFAFTEAEFFSIFRIQHEDDHKKIRGFIPDVNLKNRLPEYNSRYYDVKQNHIFQLGPTPSGEEIVAAIDKRLQPKRKWF